MQKSLRHHQELNPSPLHGSPHLAFDLKPIPSKESINSPINVQGIMKSIERSECPISMIFWQPEYSIVIYYSLNMRWHFSENERVGNTTCVYFIANVNDCMNVNILGDAAEHFLSTVQKKRGKLQKVLRENTSCPLKKSRNQTNHLRMRKITSPELMELRSSFLQTKEQYIISGNVEDKISTNQKRN